MRHPAIFTRASMEMGCAEASMPLLLIREREKRFQGARHRAAEVPDALQSSRKRSFFIFGQAEPGLGDIAYNARARLAFRPAYAFISSLSATHRDRIGGPPPSPRGRMEMAAGNKSQDFLNACISIRGRCKDRNGLPGAARRELWGRA